MGFTRNYDNLVTAYQCISADSNNYSNVAGAGEGYLTLVNWGGASNTLLSNTYISLPTSLLSFINNDNESAGGREAGYYRTFCNLICGPGTYDADNNLLEENYDDNVMKYFQNSQISKVKHWQDLIQYDEETKTWTNTYHKVYTAQETITIREIGIRAYQAGGCLLYRKVLDNPITITVDDVPVNFEITFTQTVKTGLSEAYYDTKIETYEEGEVDWS